LKGSGDPEGSKLESTAELTVEEETIADLTGLEHCSGLRKLQLRSTELADVTSLAGLTQLHTLELRGSKITDVTPLAGLIKVPGIQSRIKESQQNREEEARPETPAEAYIKARRKTIKYRKRRGKRIAPEIAAAELEALGNTQARIERIWDGLESGEHRYRVLSGHDLFGWVEAPRDWSAGTSWGDDGESYVRTVWVTVETPEGLDLDFEVVVGDGGDVEEVTSPYDFAAGRTYDTGKWKPLK
jgi:hypothetical protein